MTRDDDARSAPMREGSGRPLRGRRAKMVEKQEERGGLDEKLMGKAIELFKRLESLQDLPKFDEAEACIDFHPKKSVVFIPAKELIAEVENEELTEFVARHNVRTMLVDALWPTNAGILQQLLESGIEVRVLTRPSALHGYWRSGNEGKPRGLVEWLLKHHPDVLKGFKEDIKADAFDAVLLRYVAKKFIRRITMDFLTCWPRMLLFRHRRREHQRLLNQVSILPIPQEEKQQKIRRSEEELLEEARIFVETVRRCYPMIDELFRELGIGDDDIIAQALACEVFLEVDENKGLKKNMNKAGIRSRKLPQTRGRRRTFYHDGAMTHATTQLAVKFYGRPPISEEDEIQVARLKRQTITPIWSFKRRALSRAAWSGEARDRPFKRFYPRPERGRGLIPAYTRLGP